MLFNPVFLIVLMKKVYFLVVVTSFILLSFYGKGQVVVGGDNASNYASWADNDNFGSGFGPWDLFINPNGGGTAGFFLGDAVAQGFGDVNTGGKAFSMFGNPFGSDQANAQRLVSDWGAGYAFEIDLAVAFRNGYKGIDLFANGFDPIFTFNVENDQYKAQGDNLGWTYSQTSIFHLAVFQLGNSLQIRLTRGSDNYQITIDDKTFSGFKVFVASTSDGNDLNNIHFNNLIITRSSIALFDDFNRPASDIVGIPSSLGSGNWIENETLPSGARAEGAGLRMSSATAGREMIAYDMTPFYSPAFNATTSDMQWAFNMQQSRMDPSGFNMNNYGSAFILGCNKSNYTDADAFGYAVVLGETGSSDSLKLVSFQNGLFNSSISEISAVKPISPTSLMSIRVTYESCSQTWTLEAREESMSFTNPSVGAFPLSDSGVDGTLTAIDLPFMGALWNHVTDGSEFARFDNFYIPQTAFDVLYTWTGTENTDYQNAGNWNPARTCPRSRDVLVFNSGTAVTIDNLLDQTVGQMRIENGTTLTLRDPTDEPALPSVLTFSGGNGVDLFLEAGSILNLSTENTLGLVGEGVNLNLLTGATAEFFGQVNFTKPSISSPSRSHAIFAADSAAVRVKSGAAIVAETLSSAHPFGSTGQVNTIIFESGSTYRSESGGNPFGFDQPASKVVFESGSTYQHVGNHSFSYAGRNYADFDFVSGDRTLTFGSSPWKVDSLIFQSGTLNISAGIDIEIKNNFNCAGGTFSYSPSPPAAMRFSGNEEQRLRGAGNLILSDSATVEIDNTALGVAFRLDRDITLRGDFNILDGEVRGTGATLTMLGDDKTMSVAMAGSILGTDVGFGNDINLIATGQRTNIIGTGTACKFFNVTVDIDDTLAIGRVIEVSNGLFDVRSSAKLIINNMGAVLTTSPTYNASSQLIYNTSNSYGRGLEWTSNEAIGNPGYPGNVIIQNNTILNTDNTTAELGIQNDLIIGTTAGGIGTLDMNSDTQPLQVGGDLLLAEGTTIARLTLSDQLGGDLKIKGDFIKVADDAIGIFEQLDREVVMNGAAAQNIIGFDTLDFLGIENTAGGVQINGGLLIDNRLRLGTGMLDLNGNVLTMEGGSELMRESSTASITAAPTVVTPAQYDLRYTGVLTTGLEWADTDAAIRDLLIEADIALVADRTFNRNIILDGADLDLNGYVLLARGLAPSPAFSGALIIRQPGNRTIDGALGSRFDIIGLGGTDAADFTKQVVNDGADSLIFDSDVEVRIGNGGADFGAGNPTLIKGVLAVRAGGYIIDNSCFYGANSILRFANGFDYQVDAGDKTWGNGAIESGLPGIPYNVEVLENATDLTLNSPRSLRNDLNIADGTFSLTGSSGAFNIGGNWTRSGTTSAFNHNDQEVIFNGTVPQTIATDNGETFYRLSFENMGAKTLNEDITILENLNILGSGALDGNTETITLLGNWNNMVGTAAFTESNSKVIFAGNGTQRMDAQGEETFYDLEMQNSDSGLVLMDPVLISGDLSFVDGVIHIAEGSLTMVNGSTTDGGNNEGYVNGPMRKEGFIDSLEFKFPVGDYRNISDSIIHVYQPVALIPNATDATAIFSARYFHENYIPGTTNPSNPPPVDGSIQSASTCNYWIVNRNLGSVDARVKLFYNDSSCISVGDASSLTVVKWTGTGPTDVDGSWENKFQTGFAPTMAPYNEGFVISGVVDSFSPFTFGNVSSNLNVLPIELVSFAAKAVGQTVHTHWVTSTEIDNDFFTVERSIDAQVFEEVGRLAGAGNSMSELTYDFVDDAPYTGISYYRLRQTDFDGTTTHSDIRAVEIYGDGDFQLINAYRGYEGLEVVYRSKAAVLTAEVFDVRGKLLLSQQLRNDGGRAQLQLELARGIYLLRLGNGNEMQVIRFLY